MVIGIATSAISQSSYPKKILWENDTVLAISKDQLIKINRTLNSYVHLKKTNEILRMDLSVSDSLIHYLRESSLKKDTLISMEVQKFDNSCRIIKNLQESLDTQKTKSRKTIIGVGVGGTLFGVLLGVLLR